MAQPESGIAYSIGAGITFVKLSALEFCRVLYNVWHMGKIQKLIVSGLCTMSLIVGVGLALQPAPAYALLPPEDPGGGSAPSPTSSVCKTGDPCGNFIDKYLNPIILLLSAMVGVFAVISIIVAGIQYSSSADDPGKVSKAKQRIFNTLIGLIAYIFLFAFLQYLVPGGMF